MTLRRGARRRPAPSRPAGRAPRRRSGGRRPPQPGRGRRSPASKRLDAGQRVAARVIVAAPTMISSVVRRSLLDGPTAHPTAPLDEPVVAVVAEPTAVAAVLHRTRATGPTAVVARQHLRASRRPSASMEVPRRPSASSLATARPTAVVIVSGSCHRHRRHEDPCWWVRTRSDAARVGDVEWVRRSIRQVDAELRAGRRRAARGAGGPAAGGRAARGTRLEASRRRVGAARRRPRGLDQLAGDAPRCAGSPTRARRS